jgi:hypothetical protein
VIIFIEAEANIDSKAIRRDRMNVERIVFAFAGVVILISVLLTQYHNPNWMWLTVFVGANLLQSAFTRFCPLATMLKKIGAKPGQAF